MDAVVEGDIGKGHRYHEGVKTSTTRQLTNAAMALLDDPSTVTFVTQVMRDAFAAIMAIYNRGPVAEQSKECGSPVTEADLVSAAIIEQALRARFGLPVVCEEGKIEEFTGDAEDGKLFWLVDPLDGTKEFLKRNGEFTVNIALVSGDRPVFGMIGIPVTGEIYIGLSGRGAYRLEGAETRPIFNRRTGNDLVAAVSRSHGLGAADSYLEAIGVVSTIACGSALKFCRVAEGQSDVYVRFGRTMEWDTAAGQCILEETGCRLIDAATGETLKYGKPGYANPSFIGARGDLDLPRSPSPVS